MWIRKFVGALLCGWLVVLVHLVVHRSFDCIKCVCSTGSSCLWIVTFVGTLLCGRSFLCAFGCASRLCLHEAYVFEVIVSFVDRHLCGCIVVRLGVSLSCAIGRASKLALHRALLFNVIIVLVDRHVCGRIVMRSLFAFVGRCCLRSRCSMSNKRFGRVVILVLNLCCASSGSSRLPARRLGQKRRLLKRRCLISVRLSRKDTRVQFGLQAMELEKFGCWQKSKCWNNIG